MEMEGNFGGWGYEDQGSCFLDQQIEQPQALDSRTQQIGQQQFGPPLNTSLQPLMSELVAQELEAVIPKVVEPVLQGLIPVMNNAMHFQLAQGFEAFIPKVVEEMKKVLNSSGLRSFPNQPDESNAARILQLHFVGSLSDTLHTLTNIIDSKDPLMVELCDRSGCRVKVGPQSSAKVRLVVLDGDFEADDRTDWTREEFMKYVAKPRKDRGPLLKGNFEIKLCEGVAVFTDIAFTDNSNSMRNGTFRLGAELVNGVAREAVTPKAFKVKERRLLVLGKSLSLKDNARYLKNIGDIMCKKLEKKRVNTVMDFLQLYNTDAKALQKDLHISEKKLSETVKDAKLCPLNEKGYSYYNDTEGVVIVLDCVFNVKSVGFKGQASQCYESLDEWQKNLINKLRCHAYEKKEDLQRICIESNQISVQAQPLCPSSIQKTNMQFADTTAENLGEQTLHVNKSPLCSLGLDDGFQVGSSELYSDKLDETVQN